ncbi:hypothetical protein B0H17DRAFT_1196110 [Mycena rosella]|uniref:STB6-like N-terminal domain-containing protein n=1 Tax=Mycena rosella TaxID=1033263 RepID=A0AAD7DUL7_MYCRO|nr:hypothetical protein B0H17DRAFT_1196110 [Mycena rosella]
MSTVAHTLLLPTVRQPQSRLAAPLSHQRNRSKLARSSGSVDITGPLSRPTSPTDTVNDWIGLPLRFEIVTDRLELEGYQIYAVEKWIVDRDRPVIVLTVYTGDPAHKITVTALRPSASLSPAEATAEWDKAILHLRRDARPRETPHGVVLATSLAHFRSDYTIVHIPSGDFLLARDQLYTNINLLRMGCSGRSALTLEEPSDTTKDRFITTYHLPDTIVSPSGAPANVPVAPALPGSPILTPQPSPAKHRPRLSISPPSRRSEDHNTAPSPTGPRRPPTTLHITPPTPTFTVPQGLLSPSPSATPGGRFTSKGKTRGDSAAFNASVLELVRLLQAGLAIFGLFPSEPRALDGLLCDKTVEGLGTWVTDATERIADPAVVCALLSLVLATRNKLAVMGFGHRKRPGGVHAWHAELPLPSPRTRIRTLAPSTPGSSTLTFNAGRPNPAAYSDRAGERRRSRGARALLRRDGEGSDGASGERARMSARRTAVGDRFLTGIGSLVGLNVGGSGAGGAAGVLEPSTPARRDGGTLDRDRAKERWAPVVVSDGDVEDGDLRVPKSERDGRSTEEEGGGLDKWGGRVQKKFESWTRLNRLDRKKGHASIDISSGRDSFEDATGPTLLKKRPPLPHDLSMAPMTFVRGDEDDLSSGQVSPIVADDPRTPKQFGDMRSAGSSAANLNPEEYDRKLSAFNHKRPWGTRAREILDADESEESIVGEEDSWAAVGITKHSCATADVLYEEPSDAGGYLSDARRLPPPKRRPATFGPRRRRSWHQDPASFKDLKVLSPERMRIDVALCGQVLIMTRREEHLKDVLACIQVLTTSLSETNTRLREDYQTHVRALLEVEQQSKAIADIDVEASKADKILQAQNTISYETQQFLVPDLWHIASPPRHTTFALRDKVFGMGGRRLAPGKHGAHGRFNRLQWTLDGQERLVDHLGRTESEADEESIIDIDELRLPPTEDEEVVEHPAMRPMWLLRFFTSWGTKWGAAAQPDAEGKTKAKAGSEVTASGNGEPFFEPKDGRAPTPTPLSRASI